MSNSFFWKIQRGEMPRPAIAETLKADIIEFDEEQGTLSSRFVAGHEFTNPTGAVQGGILTAMLDATIGPCMGMTLGDNEFAPTLNINVSFIAAAAPGDFVGHARLINQGRSICYGSAELFDQRGKLVATATATAKVVRYNR